MRFFYLTVLSVFFANVALAAPIEDIKITGNQRIEKSTVIAYMTINQGDEYSEAEVAQSVKSLFATGLFSDVNITQEDNTLNVSLVENPLINQVAFEGNRQIDDEDLAKEVHLKSRSIYNSAKVQKDARRIEELYRRDGYFSVKVSPKIIKLEENRVNLVFEVDEGKITEIKEIYFIGNKAFNDGDLEDVVMTEEARWYRVFSSNDTYDPDRLLFDADLLKKHYMNNGYADFEVLSAVGEFNPEENGFIVTFSMNEGEKYKFGTVQTNASVADVRELDLSEAILTEEGELFNYSLIEKSVDNLIDELGRLGYAFVDINPIMKKENGVVNVIYNITEGQRVYIERINITGNVRTLDRVIRREMRFAEGDPFSTTKLKRSEARIKNLGFFSGVNIKTEHGSLPDKIVINIDVQEQSTGSLNFAAGYSTSDGALGSVSIQENNLLGKGQRLKANFSLAAKMQQIDLGFTEPYFMGRDVAAGIDLFAITRDFQNEASYDINKKGFKLRASYSITEYLRHTLYYLLKEDEITDVDSTASLYIQLQEGRTLTSLVGHKLVYDKRDTKFNTGSGYYVSLSNDIAGLGGDTAFLRSEVKGAYFHSVAEDWVLQLSGNIGYIVGLGKDVPINERFFVGGSNLRGFESAGVGPRDALSNDALGGNVYYTGSAELTFPLGDADEMGFRGAVFADFGSLWDVDDATGISLLDEASIRSSVGVGLAWASPMGPIRLDFATPITKEEFDETEVFRLSFGTRF